MATGKVISWNGDNGWIVSEEYEEKIFFDLMDFKQNYNPNIGDELTFRIKKVKDKQTQTIVLHAKKIKYVNFNYAMNPHERTGRRLVYKVIISIVSLGVISSALFVGYVFLL